MAERRSLVSAVSTPIPGVDTETMRAFVTQSQIDEKPVTEPVSPSIGMDRFRSEKLSKVVASELPAMKPRNKKQSRFQPAGLIAVTVRLRSEIAGGLKRAALERELKGEEVFTQQDIVENVLEPWLRQNGFLNEEFYT